MLPNINSPDYPRAFAESWIANWNRRDVEAVLSHFHPDCTFESPIAQSVVGRGRLKGVAELRSYWETALSRIQSLKFTLDDLCWDASRRTLVVIYTSLADGRTASCVEVMSFDDLGRQLAGRAYYGVTS
jgi:ketosteroid isomerase-like protein